MFVRDGFHIWAFILSPLWLLAHRLWLAFVIYVVGYGMVGVAFVFLRVPANAQLLAGLAIALLVGFEAPSIWRWTLTRRRWSTLGFVVGEDAEVAEQRFFANWAKPADRNSGLSAGIARTRLFDARAPRTAVAVRRDWFVSRAGRSTMSVAIVDYGSGNLHSAAKAFERAARETGHNQPIVVTNDPAAVARADRVVLPGVGAFADCRRGLDEISGMIDALEQSVRKNGKPFFGICVGMQLMAERGREYQVTPGLGWIAGEVDRITPSDPDLKIPHMGWNTLSMVKTHPLLEDIPLGPDGLNAYFVHSYELKTAQKSDLVAQADYGGPLTAIVGRDNMVGTQFHPEKSQRLGLALIANFLKWSP